MEQRRSLRYTIKVPASCVCKEFGRQSCFLEEFCEEGALLSFALTDMQRMPRRGDVVLLHMTLPFEGKPHAFELRAKVAHTSHGIMGINFFNPPLSALQALRSQIVEPEARPLSTNAQSIIKGLASIGSEYFLRTLQQFFAKSEERLQAASESARSDAEQRQLMESLTAFRKLQGGVRTQYGHYLHPVLEKFEPPPGKSTEDRQSLTQKLSLIEKDEFEDWLVVKVMISKVEGNCREALFALQLRLDELTKVRAGHQYNPFSPGVACDALKFALHSFSTTAAVERLLFRAYEDTVLATLPELYQRLNEELIHKGILPDLDLTKYMGAPASSDATVPVQPAGETGSAALPVKSAPAVPKEDYVDIPVLKERAWNEAYVEAVAPTAGGAGPSPVSPVHSSHGEWLAARSAQEFCAHTGEQVRHLSADLSVQQQIAHHAFDAARRLIDMQNQRRLQPPGSIPRMAPVQRGSLGAASMSQLLERLSGLQKAVVDNDDVATLLRSQLQAQGLQVSDEDNSVMQMVGNLLQTMVSNESLGESVKPWLKQLEVPLLKLVLQDDQIFQKDHHPARLVLNRLARLGLKGQIITADQSQAIADIVKHIKENFDCDPVVFEEVLPQLDTLMQKQEQIIQRNLQRVAQLAESEQRREMARKTVSDELDNRLGGKVVPRALITLLESGWKDLLVMTYVKSGDQGEDWKAFWKVIDDMLSLGENPQHPIDLREMLGHVKRGLELAGGGVTPQAQQRAVAELKQLVSGPSILSAEPLPVVQVPPREPEPAEESDSALQRWLLRVREMERGDWIEMHHDENNKDQLRLAWIGVDHSRFVFVNHQGMKVSDFTLNELAKLMQSGVVLLLEGVEMSPIDEALDKMVQSMYDRLAWQSTHDELTGLVNRKEFERLVERALDRSKRMQVRHVLAQVDIDQFKLVNSSASYEAGDRLLKEIAGLIAQLDHPNVIVGRVGADEFGVLLEICDMSHGQQLMMGLMEQISIHRFVADQKPFRLTASIGMVDVTYQSDSSESLIHAVDSVCAMAKETPGGNRLQVWQPDDMELARRDGVMAWVARLNQALDEQRLELRCQKIAPISSEAQHEGPHYEILLSMQDESGEMVAPGEFMQAAERYNRMQAVDRWVIDNVLSWMHKHPDKVQTMGGYSINLSGHSLNDESLMEFIFERFAKYSVPRDKICFEVTETTAISNLADAADFIREMKKIGCRFSLDDFGAGLSSYTYLKNLPVDYIKIDGSFVKGLAQDRNDYALVKSINEMGHLLGKRTIAEYVENEAILDCLNEIGVDFVQGYGIEKPRLLSTL